MNRLQTLLADTEDISVEDLWQTFQKEPKNSTEKHIPHKTARRNSHPWITPELSKLMKQRDRRYRKMKKQRTEELKAKVRTLRSVSYLVSWCFEPSQPQRAENKLQYIYKLFIPHVFLSFSLSLSQTTAQILSTFSECKTRKTTTHVLEPIYIRKHPKREPESSRETYFILWAYTGTMC